MKLFLSSRWLPAVGIILALLLLAAAVSYTRQSLRTELRAGADLYDEGMRWLTLTIRAENPEFTPEQIEAEIERRIAIIRRFDDNGRRHGAGH